MTPLPPRIEVVDPSAERLEFDPATLMPEGAESKAGWGTGALLLLGAAVLAVGLMVGAAAGLVVDQFNRNAWLGWAMLSVCAAGFGLFAAAAWREWRGLRTLARVDRLRATLAGGDPVHRVAAAQRWAASVPEGAAVLPALRTANDPDAVVALLRAGPGEALRRRADALGRQAAVQAVAGIAAVPSPALDSLFVAWRGLRLMRQVAELYGVRPGTLATLSLLRRTALTATLVGGSEIAVNAAAHALLSSPLLTHLAGGMAGAGVAARRMLVLARAAAAACDPVPPE